MSKLYTVTRGDVLRVLSNYDAKNAKQARVFIDNAGVKTRVYVTIQIMNMIKDCVDQMRNDEDLIPEIDVSMLPKEDGKGTYVGDALRNAMHKTNNVLKYYSNKISNADNIGSFLTSYIHAEAAKGGNEIHLCWKEKPRQKGGPTTDQAPLQPRRRVVVLGRLLKTFFSTDLMRGRGRWRGSSAPTWRIVAHGTIPMR